MLNHWFENDIDAVASALIAEDTATAQEEAIGGFGLKRRCARLIDLIRSAMYPQIFAPRPVSRGFLTASVRDYLQQSAILLCELCGDLLPERDESAIDAIVAEFMNSLPEIARILKTDVHAAYLGDPAARSETEIRLAYPAFEAISIYRLAHRLFTLGVPLLPRMMTEEAHERTGIDINSGATIGESFFIDHGTGVVVGETCVIGSHVKLYQGVTLGAKSFDADENGNPIKGIKRHPQIGDRVVIYAGATILGGETHIGDDCVIGSNVWLTRSVEAGSFVYYNASVSCCKK